MRLSTITVPILTFIAGIIASSIGTYLGYLFKVKYDKRNSKVNHDKKLFNDIQKLLSDNDVTRIHKEAAIGYLLLSKNGHDYYASSDDLNRIVETPGKSFLHSILNEKLKNFIDSYEKLIIIFNACPYADTLPGGSKRKLIYHKKSDAEEFDWLSRCKRAAENFNDSYREYRDIAKVKLLV